MPGGDVAAPAVPSHTLVHGCKVPPESCRGWGGRSAQGAESISDFDGKGGVTFLSIPKTSKSVGAIAVWKGGTVVSPMTRA